MSARGFSSLPDPLGLSVRRELDRLGAGSAAGASLAELVGAWPAAVGAEVARNAWPARLGRDGTLTVHTSSSAWAFELGQLEATVRERLGRRAPKRLRFVVGPLPEPAEAVKRTEQLTRTPAPADWELGAEIAREIEDPRLRELVARAAATAAAADRFRPETTGRSDTLGYV